MRLETVRIETSTSEHSGVPVAKVIGEIDVYTAPEFKSALNRAIDSGAANLVIDLTSVSYMDSSGFGVLLSVTKRVRPRGGSISLVGCSEAIERMLKITRLDTIFDMYSTVEEATGAY